MNYKDFICLKETKNTLTVAEIAKILDDELEDVSTMESGLVANKYAYEEECRVIMDRIIDYVKERDGELKA